MSECEDGFAGDYGCEEPEPEIVRPGRLVLRGFVGMFCCPGVSEPTLAWPCL